MEKTITRRKRQGQKARARRPTWSRLTGLDGNPKIVMQTARVARYSQIYIAQSAATFTITGKNLLNWIQMAATSTTSYRLFASHKLEKVEMWSPTIVSTTSNTGVLPASVSLEWYGPTIGYENSNKIIAVAEGSEPAYISSRPPRQSSVSWWRQSGSVDGDTTDTIFTLAGQLGFMVRITFQAKLVDDETVYGAEAPAGATVGKVYYNYLDGRTSGGLQPLGVNIIP